MMNILKNIFRPADTSGSFERKDSAILVDVRTPEEFNSGHLDESINIPLGSIQNHIRDFKMAEKPIVLVCRSGARSGRASELLRSYGVDAYNGGPWNTYKV